MQSFLPFADFARSAACLDMKRLGNQRSEAKVLYESITVGNGWSKHPASKMWVGYEDALAWYGVNICQEWISRGYQDTLLPYFMDKRKSILRGIALPNWLGNEAFHSSHRAALLHKNLEWYSQFNWVEQAALAYIWPVSDRLLQPPQSPVTGKN